MFIESLQDPAIFELRDELASMAAEMDNSPAWPRKQLQLCADRGVYRWFLPTDVGGIDWSASDVARGYQILSSGCLTTTFIITQYLGACRRIAGSENEMLRTFLLPQLLTGQIFATVGISHLTTSRRHLSKPVLLATEVDGGFVLNGFSPWVTGGAAADIIVVGAQLEDGRQILASVPVKGDTIKTPEPQLLVALNSSKTGPVEFRDHLVPHEQLLAGPVVDVMTNGGGGARTGGVQTSTLAVGLAMAALEFLQKEAENRPDLADAGAALSKEIDGLVEDIENLTSGNPVCSTEDLRIRANSAALRTAQAALTAAKGSGFVVGHPAGRWCREALFFLVWSCPQPVLSANLCELAGITG